MVLNYFNLKKHRSSLKKKKLDKKGAVIFLGFPLSNFLLETILLKCVEQKLSNQEHSFDK